MRDVVPVFFEIVGRQRRSLLVWSLALGAISAMYLSFYPSMGGDTMNDLIADLPEDMVTALGYDRIGSAGGWVTSTVYGLLGPILLIIFGTTVGARLIAGEEEVGTLELEATAPLSRTRLLVERFAALTTLIAVLVAVVTLVCWILISVLDMAVPLEYLLAGSAGLFLLALGFGAVAFGVGAATGHQSTAVGVSGVLAVVAFMFDALGPVVELQWMSEVSPFYWFLGQNPLIEGFDWVGLVKLAVVTPIAIAVGLLLFRRRDLKI